MYWKRDLKFWKERRFKLSDSDVIDIAQVCVIIHNILDCICVNGELDDEIDANGDALRPNEIIDEIYYPAELNGVHIDNIDYPQDFTQNDENQDLTVIQTLFSTINCLCDKYTHVALQVVVTYHVWSKQGDM